MPCRQELAAAVAAEGLRPILAQDMPPQLARLLEAAWQLQPEQRPTAAQLEAALRSTVEHLASSTPSHAQLHNDQAANGISVGSCGMSGLPSGQMRASCCEGLSGVCRRHCKVAPKCRLFLICWGDLLQVAFRIEQLQHRLQMLGLRSQWTSPLATQRHGIGLLAHMSRM